jgi:hypothetical protein
MRARIFRPIISSVFFYLLHRGVNKGKLCLISCILYCSNPDFRILSNPTSVPATLDPRSHSPDLWGFYDAWSALFKAASSLADLSLRDTYIAS